MAIADLAAGFVAFPDQTRIAGGEIFLLGVHERRVPAPAVSAGHAHAALEQVEGCLAAHAATLGDIIGAAVGRARARVHQHDVERREPMTDALELGFNVARAGDVTIREMTEVELDGGLKAPFERYLVDCDRALAAIHGGGEMPRCVEVCGVVGREPDPLDRPALAIWQILVPQAGKELDHVRRRLPVGEIVDLRAVARGIGGDVVFQRHGNVDELACHEQHSLCFKFAVTVPRGVG